MNTIRPKWAAFPEKNTAVVAVFPDSRIFLALAVFSMKAIAAMRNRLAILLLIVSDRLEAWSDTLMTHDRGRGGGA